MSVPTPAALRPTPRPAVDVVDAAAAEASRFGRVDPDGTVYVRTPDGEVVVGQYAAGPPNEGLAFFVRRYLDLLVEIDLIRRRLGEARGTPEQAQAVLEKVRHALATTTFVGDIQALRDRCDQLAQEIQEAAAAKRAMREAERAASRAAREALAEEAETLSTSTSWRTATERFSEIVAQWTALPRVDRASEQVLWKRISGARTRFDKRRRQHFAELGTARKDALQAKRELITRAEELAQSTDWTGTARRFRDLVDAWKQAPRGSRQDEDRLWKRFKAAQDAFFAAKAAAERAAEEALLPNVATKEALVVEAEALLPISDTKAAKTALRSIAERWENAGDLPRADRERLEGRLRKVEEAVRRSEADSWRRSNPEARARAESTAQAFAQGIGRMETQLDAARARGDARETARLESALAQTRALLAAAESAADEFRGASAAR